MNASGENSIVIDTKEIFGQFIAESIAQAVLGNDSKASEIHKVIKFIENDFTSLTASIKILLNSFVPKTFKMKLLRNEVQEFFKKNLTQEVREKTDKSNLVQMIIQSTRESGHEAEAITEQFLIHFVGGYFDGLFHCNSVMIQLFISASIQR